MQYRVGENIFRNKYLAHLESSRVKQPVIFDLWEKVFDLVDWSREPDTPWAMLMDLRAQQLAARRKPIVLGFSGGTDSFTVYEVFKRNRIPLAAVNIRIKNDPAEKILYQQALDFIHAESRQHGFRVIVSEETSESVSSFYDSEEWIWKENARLAFTVGIAERLQIENNPDWHRAMDPDYIYVIGHEKPRLEYIDGSFYSYQVDVAWQNLHDRIEPFFITPALPELHVKQSYMLARWALKKHRQMGRSMPCVLDDHYTCEEHLDYSIEGCGRIGDLANSHLQKYLNHKGLLLLQKSDVSRMIYRGRSNQILQEGLNSSHPYALNYIKGLLLVKKDTGLQKLWTDNHAQTNLVQEVIIKSKSYRLEALHPDRLVLTDHLIDH